MQRQLLFSNFFRIASVSVLLLGGFSVAQAQGLYIGADVEFFIDSGLPFTTSGNSVEVADSGSFVVNAGSTWGDEQDFVNGKVKAIGSGTTKLPLGKGAVFAPVVAVHTGELVGEYFDSPPSNGSAGQGVDAIGTNEYWELSGSAVITLPWNEDSGMEQLVNNNGGVFNSITIVGLNNGVWDLVSASQSTVLQGDLSSGDVTSDPNQEVDLNSYNQITFGIDSETVLSVEDLLFSSGFNLISNPIRSFESEIRFTSEQEFNNLKISVYDLNGRLVRSVENVDTHNGFGRISKGKIRSGLYFVKFEEDGRQGVKKMIVE